MDENKTLLLEILRLLDREYPQMISFIEMRKVLDAEKQSLTRALFLLHEDELIDAVLADSLEGKAVAGATITTKGQRHLRGEEEFITVKLHNDTLESLREILLSCLTESALPKNEKGALRKAIESAPTTAVNEVVKMILAAGLQKAPELLNQIPALLSRLA